MQAIESPMRFSSGTIDQPGKPISQALHGVWLGGPHPFHESDALMLVGMNPLVALSGGIPNQNPGRRLRRARDRGFKLVVIDPRKTETARQAAVHLQPRPGEDPAILAGILRILIREGLCDDDFVEMETQGFDALARAVEPFTPEWVAQRADIPAAQLVEAARIFGNVEHGSVMVGTGPNMSGRGNLTEYLALCINSVCGRWRRAGERVSNPGVLEAQRSFKAQPSPPRPAWNLGQKLRVRGFSMAASGLPTAALADEILMEGEGQIKALITVGGNPLLAWPDQKKTLAAMKALEFHVVIDPRMTPTARLADYVIAPKLPLEVPGITLSLEALGNRSVGWGYQEPYAQYSPAIVPAPAGSDLVEELEFFYHLAQHMDLSLKLRCEMFPFAGAPSPHIAPLDMQNKPTTEELLDCVTQNARIPLARVRAHDGGRLYDGETVLVEPRDADCDARLELANPTMLSELREVIGEGSHVRSTHGHLLISRRMPHHYNSYATDFETLSSRYGSNPAFMNPEDLEALCVAKGDPLVIRSEHGEVEGIAWPDPGLRRGLVSMSHCWGDNPDVKDSRAEPGANTGMLSSVEVDYDPYTGIPRMSAIPVDVLAGGDRTASR
jgi:anaerobic selenocysteine-containing dehydrogenase